MVENDAPGRDLADAIVVGIDDEEVACLVNRHIDGEVETSALAAPPSPPKP
jgi:hypothetical protein